MTQIKRRTVLGGLAALVGSLVAGPVVDATVPAGAEWQGDPQEIRRRSRALAKLRLLNTIENSVFRESAGYWHHADLLAAPIAARMAERLSGGRAQPLGRLDDVPGFHVLWSLDADRQGYEMTMVDGTGFSLRTDQSGVIRQGTMQRAANGEWDVDGLVATPIERRQPMPATGVGRVRGAVAQIATFFVPTLHAEDNSYFCCSGCNGGCQGPGECCCCPGCTSCEAACCNSGYQSCTWCCEIYLCGCFYTCLS